jgi:hypothetical protein
LLISPSGFLVGVSSDTANLSIIKHQDGELRTDTHGHSHSHGMGEVDAQLIFFLRTVNSSVLQVMGLDWSVPDALFR